MSDTPAVPVSRPVDLEAWERLARAAKVLIAARSRLAIGDESAQWAQWEANRVFEDLVTPERILGLIGEVRRSQSGQEQKQNDEG